MATPEPLEPSRRLSEAAGAELAALRRHMSRIDERRRSLTEQLEQLDAQRARFQERLELLQTLVPEPSERRFEPVEAALTEPVRGYLSGSAIRRQAVRLLAESRDWDSPIHYTDWLARLTAAGYGIRSHDAAASFLTQINRSPLVVRTDRPGMYTLDLDAPERLRERLNELHRELLAIHDGQQTLDGIVSTRERRDELVLAIGRTERALEDALSTLAD
jgi:hypothetical protein